MPVSSVNLCGIVKVCLEDFTMIFCRFFFLFLIGVLKIAEISSVTDFPDQITAKPVTSPAEFNIERQNTSSHSRPRGCKSNTTRSYESSSIPNSKLDREADDEEEEENCDSSETGQDPGVPPSLLELLARQPDQLLMFNIANHFSLYVHPVICAVGVLGNTMSFLVMMMRHNRRMSSCIYMASLAVADNWLLVVVFVYWLKSSAGLGPLTSPECAWLIYLGVVPGTIGMMCVVSMTTERFVAVRFPFKSGQLCTAKRAKITVIVITIIIIIYSLPYLFYSGAVQNGADCFPLVEVTTFTTVYSFVSLALNSAVPFTILIIFNSLIIHTIRNRKKFFKKDQEVDKGTSKESAVDAQARKDEKARERQLTIMLVMVSFTFLILTFPGYLRVVVDLITGMSKDLTQFGSFMLYYSVTIRLYYLNSAVNFFLYCLGGSRFRADVINLVTCFRRGAKQTGSQVSGSQTFSNTTKASSISESVAA